jgi:hypothetical protein
MVSDDRVKPSRVGAPAAAAAVAVVATDTGFLDPDIFHRRFGGVSWSEHTVGPTLWRKAAGGFSTTRAAAWRLAWPTRGPTEVATRRCDAVHGLSLTPMTPRAKSLVRHRESRDLPRCVARAHGPPRPPRAGVWHGHRRERPAARRFNFSVPNGTRPGDKARPRPAAQRARPA